MQRGCWASDSLNTHLKKGHGAELCIRGCPQSWSESPSTVCVCVCVCVCVVCVCVCVCGVCVCVSYLRGPEVTHSLKGTNVVQPLYLLHVTNL